MYVIPYTVIHCINVRTSRYLRFCFIDRCSIVKRNICTRSSYAISRSFSRSREGCVAASTISWGPSRLSLDQYQETNYSPFQERDLFHAQLVHGSVSVQLKHQECAWQFRSQYGIYYLMFTTFTDLFSETYGFNTGTVGLSYIGLGVGFFISTACCARFADQNYNYVRRSLAVWYWHLINTSE